MLHLLQIALTQVVIDQLAPLVQRIQHGINKLVFEIVVCEICSDYKTKLTIKAPLFELNKRRVNIFKGILAKGVTYCD